MGAIPAQAFTTSLDTVARAVRRAVDWGLAHRVLERVQAIGIDEIAWKKGHKYLTVVYQIDAECRRLLWIGKGRKESTLQGFFDKMGDALKQTRVRRQRYVEALSQCRRRTC